MPILDRPSSDNVPGLTRWGLWQSPVRPMPAPVTGVVIPGGLPAPILGGVSPGGSVRSRPIDGRLPHLGFGVGMDACSVPDMRHVQRILGIGFLCAFEGCPHASQSRGAVHLFRS